MRLLACIAFALLATGCSSIKYNIPISQFDLPDSACTPGPGEFTWQGETRPYTLYITDDPDQLYALCGPDAQACIRGSEIVTPSPCKSHLAHELSHLFGMDGVDRPRVAQQ